MPLSTRDGTIFKEIKSDLFSIAVEAKHLALFFWERNVFEPSHIQIIDHEVTDEEKIYKVFTFYESRADDLHLLKVALKESGYEELAQKVEDIEAKAVSSAISSMSVPSDQFMVPKFEQKTTEIIKKIRQYYTRNFKHIWPLPTNKSIRFEMDQLCVNVNVENRTDNQSPTDQYKSYLLTALQDGGTVLIRGEPGAGKSTLAKLLCYQWACNRLPQFDLVLFARFREVTDTNSVLDLIMSWMMSPSRRVLPKHLINHLAQFIEEERMTWELRKAEDDSSDELHVLVILDGLDEFAAKCEELEGILENEDMPNLPHSLIITSRPQAFKNVCCLVPMIKLHGFNAEQQDQYIWQHFSNHKETQQQNWQAVRAKLSSVTELRKLAQTPLTLSYICLVHAHLESNTEAELLRLVGNYLVKRYEVEKKPTENPFGENWLDSEPIRNLCLMALEGYLSQLTENEKVLFTKSDLDQFNIDQACLDVGFLMADEVTDWPQVTDTMYYWFQHKSFQDFLVAFLIHMELTKVPQIDEALASQWIVRYVEKTPHESERKKIRENPVYVNASMIKANSEAMLESEWLAKIFRHTATTAISEKAWKFILELALESDILKVIHNSVVFWKGSSDAQHFRHCRKMDVGLIFALRRKLGRVTESQLDDIIRDQINYRPVPEIVNVIVGNLKIMRLDEHEYHVDTIASILFSSAQIPNEVVDDWSADFLRQHLDVKSFVSALVEMGVLWEFLAATEEITQITNGLNVHVSGSLPPAPIQPKTYWRTRLPKPQPLPVEQQQPCPNVEEWVTSALNGQASTRRGPRPNLEELMTGVLNMMHVSEEQKTTMLQACQNSGLFSQAEPSREKLCRVPDLILVLDLKGEQENEIQIKYLWDALMDKISIEKVNFRAIQPVRITDFTQILSSPTFIEGSIKTINLEKVLLTKDDVIALIDVLHHCKKLEYFRIRQSGINGQDLVNLTSSIRENCKNIENFAVQEQCLKDEVTMRQFCIRLKGWKELHVLTLTDNKLTHKLVSMIIEVADHMPGLTFLCLINNQVTNKQMEIMKGKNRYDVRV